MEDKTREVQHAMLRELESLTQKVEENDRHIATALSFLDDANRSFDEGSDEKAMALMLLARNALDRLTFR
jgi:hypothetical protein